METVQLAALLIIVVGIFLEIGAIIALIKKSAFLKEAKDAMGIVTALVQSDVSAFTSSPTDGNLAFRAEENIFAGVSYAPNIEYETQAGEKFAFKGIASSPPRYKVGDNVRVLYMESEPGKAVIDSFFGKWLVFFIVSINGTILLTTGILLFIFA